MVVLEGGVVPVMSLVQVTALVTTLVTVKEITECLDSKDRSSCSQCIGI